MTNETQTVGTDQWREISKAWHIYAYVPSVYNTSVAQSLSSSPGPYSIPNLEENSSRLTMFASERVLSREWGTPEEDEAWAHLYKATSGTEKPEQARFLAHLERAVRAGDIRTFVTILKEVSWERRRPEDFVEAIKLALNVSAPTAAQYLYDEGIKRHPQSPELARYARLFASARSSTRTLPPNSTLKANREWLKSHRSEYRGQWIALRNGQLLATAASLEDLTNQVGDITNALLTRA